MWVSLLSFVAIGKGAHCSANKVSSASTTRTRGCARTRFREVGCESAITLLEFLSRCRKYVVWYQLTRKERECRRISGDKRGSVKCWGIFLMNGKLSSNLCKWLVVRTSYYGRLSRPIGSVVIAVCGLLSRCRELRFHDYRTTNLEVQEILKISWKAMKWGEIRKSRRNWLGKRCKVFLLDMICLFCIVEWIKENKRKKRKKKKQMVTCTIHYFNQSQKWRWKVDGIERSTIDENYVKRTYCVSGHSGNVSWHDYSVSQKGAHATIYSSP